MKDSKIIFVVRDNHHNPKKELKKAVLLSNKVNKTVDFNFKQYQLDVKPESSYKDLKLILQLFIARDKNLNDFRDQILLHADNHENAHKEWLKEKKVILGYSEKLNGMITNLKEKVSNLESANQHIESVNKSLNKENECLIAQQIDLINQLNKRNRQQQKSCIVESPNGDKWKVNGDLTTEKVESANKDLEDLKKVDENLESILEEKGLSADQSKVYTIQDIKDGKVAVINEGNFNKVREVVEKSFPEAQRSIEGIAKYYFRHPVFSEEWAGGKETILPYQSAELFLIEDNSNVKENNEVAEDSQLTDEQKVQLSYLATDFRDLRVCLVNDDKEKLIKFINNMFPNSMIHGNAKYYRGEDSIGWITTDTPPSGMRLINVSDIII